MQEQRKQAYLWLLYWAMIDIRGTSGYGWYVWRSWNPLRWREAGRALRYVGAVADWLHNLGSFASHDFDGFDEERFWRMFDVIRAEFPDRAGMLGYYRDEFERRADGVTGGRPAEPGAAPDRCT